MMFMLSGVRFFCGCKF